MPIDIPEHLRYRAPKPKSTVANISSRYKEPKQYIDPEQFYESIKPPPFRAHSPTNPNFHDVTARYNQEKTRRVGVEEKPLVAKSESIFMTSEYKSHKHFAKASGVSEVQSHWHELPNMEDVITPRMVVEQKQAQARMAQIKEGSLFKVQRSNTTSFGELLKRESSPPRPSSPSRKSAHSVVMNWVNNGVPIPGTENQTVSPTRRKASETKPVFVAGKYSRPKVPQKYAAVKEEKAVIQLCETLSSARTTSPPRVAYLPPKNQLPPSPQRHRLSSPSKPRSVANNVMSRSPSRAAPPLITAQSTSGRSQSPDTRGSSPVSRRNSIALTNIPVQSAVNVPKSVKAFEGRSISPTRHVGGGASTLTTSALRRSTSPMRTSQADGDSSAYGLSNSTANRSEFLPFNTAPPPQLRRV